MATPGPATPPDAGAPAPPARWVVLGALLAVLALGGALAAGALALVATPVGLRIALAGVERLWPGMIAVDRPVGALNDAFGAARVVVAAGGTRITIEDLQARFARVRLRPLALDFDYVRAARVLVRLAPPAPGASPLARITPPLAIAARELAVGTLGIGRSDAPDQEFALHEIAADVTITRDAYQVAHGALQWQGRRAILQGRVDGAPPYAIAASATVASPLLAHAVGATVVAAGSLVDLALDAQLAGDGTAGGQGLLAARLACFGTPLLRALRADVTGIDPAAWVPSAPHALLDVAATLAPDPAAGTATRLHGPLQAVNRAPGTIDAGRLPVRRLDAQVTLGVTGGGAAQLSLDGLRAELTRGRAHGQFTYAAPDPGAPAPAWHGSLQLEAVDPAALHASLQSMRVDGSIDATPIAGGVMLRADLVAQQLRVKGQVRALADAVIVDAATLALGAGQLDARGRWSPRDGHISATGTAAAIDLSRLFKGVRTDLNGQLDLDAVVTPEPTGKLALALGRSTVCVEPAPCQQLAGSAQVDFAGGDRVVVAADLHAGGAQLQAHGTLSWPRGAAAAGAGATVPAATDLRIDLDAPSVAPFGLGARGGLQLHATIAGALPWPRIDATLEAHDLQHGAQSIGRAAGSFHGDGGGDGRFDGQLAVEHVALGTGGETLRSARATLAGQASQHALEVAAVTAAGQAVALAAAGGWSPAEGTRPAGWKGEVTRFEAGAPASWRLLEPMPLATDLAHWSAGPARVTALGGQFEDVRLDYDGATLQTSGRFAGLRVFGRDVLGLDPLRTGSALADQQTLTLAGRWRVHLGASADGEFDVEREGGDLVAGGIGGTTALGIDELRLDGTLRAGHLALAAVLHGARSGQVKAAASAELDRGATALDWHLARERPCAATLAADLPALEVLAPLFSERVRANLRLGGRLSGALRIDGTPAAPHANGSVEGADLRVAWIEQGVRLEDGTLQAHVVDTTVTIDALRFAGPPRAQPLDRRALQALKGAPPGFVAATGELKLPDLAGVIQVQAQHLALLQRPDRWVVASGGANIVLSAQRVQLNGAVAADAGFVDFSRADLPSLSSDVEVKAPVAANGAPAPRVAVGFDLAIDLGSSFYLRGSGLDTRVEGALRLHSDGNGIVRANGSVEAHNGTFQGFGQNLRIERGRVNFQGSLENPGLDVLALRPGLPVGVGVTVTRTAADPLIRLYNDASLSDYETLSWLVLGRAPEQSGSDTAAMASAAVGLLGGTGEGVPARLARQLGIDQVSVRSGDAGAGSTLLPYQSVAGPLKGGSAATTTTAGQIVSLGRRVNDALTISYEQGVSGAASVVQLSYQLSQRISLLARAGTENALDLVFTLAFD